MDNLLLGVSKYSFSYNNSQVNVNATDENI